MALSQSRIVVVGGGRLGTALIAALRRVGLNVAGPLGRGADGAEGDIVLLCVPDGAIATAGAAIAPGRLVGHCAASVTLAPLAPHDAFSLHPLLVVTGPETDFGGAACAVDGTTEAARATAIGLARVLGMTPIIVADADRALYHAAASLASNYLATIEVAAERLAARVGVQRKDLVPLVRAALAAWERDGAHALTGPIVRGDEATVARQRAAVVAASPELVPVWDALTDATRALARETAPA